MQISEHIAKAFTWMFLYTGIQSVTHKKNKGKNNEDR